MYNVYVYIYTYIYVYIYREREIHTYKQLLIGHLPLGAGNYYLYDIYTCKAGTYLYTRYI